MLVDATEPKNAVELPLGVFKAPLSWRAMPISKGESGPPLIVSEAAPPPPQKKKKELTKPGAFRAASLPGSSAIEKLDNAPGGGYQVTVYDPEGFPINLLHGQREPSEEDHPEGTRSPFG